MQLLKKYYQEHYQTLISFFMVGALSAVVNITIFSLIYDLINLNYQIAVSIAYILAVVVHYLANRKFTFKNKDQDYLKQISKYLIMIAINYFITLEIVKCVVEVFHLSPYLGIIASIGGTVITGYILSRFWVFKTA